MKIYVSYEIFLQEESTNDGVNWTEEVWAESDREFTSLQEFFEWALFLKSDYARGNYRNIKVESTGDHVELFEIDNMKL
jgi:hypothetical protein